MVPTNDDDDVDDDDDDNDDDFEEAKGTFFLGKLYFHRLSSALQDDLEAILVFNIRQQLFQLYEYLHSEE